MEYSSDLKKTTPSSAFTVSASVRICVARNLPLTNDIKADKKRMAEHKKVGITP